MSGSRAPRPTRDLADLVQELRHLTWLTPKVGAFYRDVLVNLLIDLDWRKPDSLRSLARALVEGQDRIEAKDLPDALQCAPRLERLAAELEADPPMPSIDDLIARYVGGEIGDRTVLWVMDWDHWQLFEACAARGLPPIQMVPRASPGALAALREQLRRLPDKDEEDETGKE